MLKLVSKGGFWECFSKGLVISLLFAVECSNLQPCNWQVVSPDELKEDGEYEEIVEDMREECGKYGKLVNLDKCEHK